MKPANVHAHSKKNVAPTTKFAKHTPPMTEQLIAPPARVWDRIEKILDEQDRQHSADKTLPSLHQKRIRVPIFAAAAASIVAGFIWLSR